MYIDATGFGSPYNDSVSRSDDGEPMVRSIINVDSDLCSDANSPCEFEIVYINSNKNDIAASFMAASNDVTVSNSTKLDTGSYKLQVKNQTDIISEETLKLGGVYRFVGHLSKAGYKGKVITITEPNSMHMAWLIPQYVVITMAEVMFSVTGLEFAFTQAPESMKSLLQAAWLLTVAFGNLIVLVIAEIDFFNRAVSISYTFYA